MSNYAIHAREKGTVVVLMFSFIDKESAEREALKMAASGKYAMLALIEYRSLSRWEDRS
jgi:hypothetical protein